MAYSDKVIDRFESVLKDPKKHAVGRFDPKDPNVATGLVGAPACGDVMKLDLKMNGDTIEDVKFKTYGCGSAIAVKEFTRIAYWAVKFVIIGIPVVHVLPCLLFHIL